MPQDNFECRDCCSLHTVIYYSKHTQKNVIYLFYTIKNQMVNFQDLVGFWGQGQTKICSTISAVYNNTFSINALFILQAQQIKLDHYFYKLFFSHAENVLWSFNAWPWCSLCCQSYLQVLASLDDVKCSGNFINFWYHFSHLLSHL